MTQFDLVCCVVNDGQGSKILKIAKHHGVKGGTICKGRGTIKNWLLDILDITDIRKEIVFMVTERESALETMKALSKKMCLHKPNHGIVFSFTLNSFIGIRHCEYFDIDEKEAVKDTVYNAIFTVVNRGAAEDVVEAATKAGARGCTIINARGSGINETDVLFAMPIEPEKEMVLIIAANDVTKPITEAIRKRARIDESGYGVLFIVGVNEAHGLY